MYRRIVSISFDTSHKALKGLELIGGDNVPVDAQIRFSTLKGSDFKSSATPTGSENRCVSSGGVATGY